MTGEQAIRYLYSSGMSDEQVATVVAAFGCEDCISRKEAIELVRVGIQGILPLDCEKEIVMDTLSDIPSVTPIPGWIPVGKRLPDKFGNYLVTFIPAAGTLWTKVMIAHYSDLMGIAKPSFHIGEVGKESFQNITKQVTAWLPLPEPYKEG